MGVMRNLLRGKPWLAIMLILLAVAVRALVPQGYMPQAQGRVLTVQICADASGIAHLLQITVPARQPVHDDGPAHADSHAKHPPCAFAGHAMPLLGAADPVVLAAALAFIMLVGLQAAAPALPARPRRLRPPLRAPPAHP